jgi:hypothetical protein
MADIVKLHVPRPERAKRPSRLKLGKTVSYVRLHRTYWRRGGLRDVYRRPTDWIAHWGEKYAWGRTRREAYAPSSKFFARHIGNWCVASGISLLAK